MATAEGETEEDEEVDDDRDEAGDEMCELVETGEEREEEGTKPNAVVMPLAAAAAGEDG